MTHDNQARPAQTKAERTPRTRPDGASAELTQRLVNEIAPPVTGKLRVPGGEVSGLFLRVTLSSAKSCILRYTNDGRGGEAGIDDARSITLVAARAKAVEMLSDLVVRKVDPAAEKQAAIKREKAKKEETFAALIARYRSMPRDANGRTHSPTRTGCSTATSSRASENASMPGSSARKS